MLKGKTKIELFDAKSGRKLRESVDENLVTNAVKNLFSLKNEWLTRDASYYKLIRTICPIYTKLYGGVLLWGDELEESADNIVQPADVKEIGHAGTTYAGTNPYRGTYNSVESGEIEGGYRHVWDFATDRANGVIKCVSLTSVWGGNCGWNQPANDGDTVFFLSPFFNWRYPNRYYTDTTAVCEYAGNGGGYFYLGTLPDGRELFVDRTYDAKTKNLGYMTKPDSSKIPLDITSQEYLQNYTKLETVTLTSETNFGISHFMDENYKIHSLSPITTVTPKGKTASYKIINALTGTVELEKTITFDTAIGTLAGTAPIAVWNGSLFVCSDNLYKFCRYALDEDYNATFIETCDLQLGTGEFSVFEGRLVYVSDKGESGGYHNMYFYDGADWQHIYSAAQTVTPSRQNKIAFGRCDNIKLPYCRLWESYLAFITPYLGTINNLESPVTKTSAQTMKITYDIYETD